MWAQSAKRGSCNAGCLGPLCESWRKQDRRQSSWHELTRVCGEVSFVGHFILSVAHQFSKIYVIENSEKIGNIWLPVFSNVDKTEKSGIIGFEITLYPQLSAPKWYPSSIFKWSAKQPKWGPMANWIGFVVTHVCRSKSQEDWPCWAGEKLTCGICVPGQQHFCVCNNGGWTLHQHSVGICANVYAHKSVSQCSFDSAMFQAKEFRKTRYYTLSTCWAAFLSTLAIVPLA